MAALKTEINDDENENEEIKDITSEIVVDPAKKKKKKKKKKKPGK